MVHNEKSHSEAHAKDLIVSDMRLLTCITVVRALQTGHQTGRTVSAETTDRNAVVDGLGAFVSSPGTGRTCLTIKNNE